MFRDREEIRRRLFEVVERFRQKGATTPEKAMSAQELGLPPILLRDIQLSAQQIEQIVAEHSALQSKQAAFTSVWESELREQFSTKLRLEAT